MEKRNCRIVSVVNWKGGVGKTTLAYHLGTGLEELEPEFREEYLGYEEAPRVLLVDSDAQCNLSIACLGAAEFERMLARKVKTLADLYKAFINSDNPGVKVEEYILKGAVRRDANRRFEKIDLLPGHPDLAFTDLDLTVYSPPSFKETMSGPPMFKFRVLSRILDEVKDQYDFIFIDCPPHMYFVTQNAVYASDFYLIPTEPEWFSVYGVHSIIAKMQEFNRMWELAENGRYQPTELAGILVNKVTERKKQPITSQATLINGLKDNYGDQVFYTYVTEGDAIPRAVREARPVYSMARSGGTAAKQTKLLRRVLVEFLGRISE